VNQTEELEIECLAPGIAVGAGEPVEAARAGRASIEIEEGRARGLERSASKPGVRVTAASDSVRQGQGRAGQRTETNGVGSGRLLGVGVGWTEEGVVERGKREAEGRATEEGGGREGRSEKRRNGSGTEGKRSQ
jgi:hypothetical protein